MSAEPAVPVTARDFPERVPQLLDPVRGVLLRALAQDDLPLLVEQCRDPEMLRWTTVPQPAGGYQLANATEYLESVADGWRTGRRLGWAVEAARDGRRRLCGTVTLRVDDWGLVGEVGFGLHPGARGRSLMSTAVRLVRDFAFDVAGLSTLRWRAVAGNWASRRVAAAAGFTFDGTVRRLLLHQGALLDGWVATMTSADPRTPQPWFPVPVLTGERVRLRPFDPADIPRIVGACADPVTRHWLVSLPQPYDAAAAQAFLDAGRELSAEGGGAVWCISDPVDGRCLGSLSLEGFGGYARRAELGYWAHPDARGRGVVSEAVRLVAAWCEAGRMVDSLMIRAAGTNGPSRRVAVAAGFTEVGVQVASEPLGDGSLADLVMYTRP